MPAITVHTTTNCQQCRATKRKLDEAGIEYKTVDVSQQEYADLADAIRARADELGTPAIMPYVTVFDEHNIMLNEWFGFQPAHINELANP
ncbi:glutaredoxin family protein [Glutamicibacter soli]